jgi:hypothetical protein
MLKAVGLAPLALVGTETATAADAIPPAPGGAARFAFAVPEGAPRIDTYGALEDALAFLHALMMDDGADVMTRMRAARELSAISLAANQDFIMRSETTLLVPVTRTVQRDDRDGSQGY